MEMRLSAALLVNWPDAADSRISTCDNLRFEHGLYREAIAEYEGALALVASQGERASILYRLAVARSRLGEFAAPNSVTIRRSLFFAPAEALAGWRYRWQDWVKHSRRPTARLSKPNPRGS
jgi:hypothetical protein